MYALGWIEVINIIYAVNVVLGGYFVHDLSMISMSYTVYVVSIVVIFDIFVTLFEV